MKKIIVLITFFCFHTLYAQNFEVGNEIYPVMFEDVSLSAIIKTNIANDISLYFKYSDSLKESFIPTLLNDNILCPDVPAFRGLNEHYAKGLRCHCNNTVTNIYVHKSLSDAYVNIYNELENIPNAYSNAVSFLNSLNTGSITNLPISEQSQYIQFNPNGNQNIPNEIKLISELNTYWINQKYYPLCVIDFAKRKFWTETNEYYSFVFRYKEKGIKIYNPLDTFYMIYYNNRWTLFGYDL